MAKCSPKSVLDIPRLGCVNVHGSLLPKYRGAGPIQWAVLNDEAETGITTMLMGEGMDTGDILVEKATLSARTKQPQSFLTNLLKWVQRCLLIPLKSSIRVR